MKRYGFEIVRVLKNNIFIMLVILFLFINIIYFHSYTDKQSDIDKVVQVDKDIESYKKDDLSIIELQKNIDDISNKMLEYSNGFGEFDNIYYDEMVEDIIRDRIEALDSEYYILAELRGRLEYVLEYTTKYDMIQNNAKSLANVGIFNKNKEVSKENILKTVEDFDWLVDIEAKLEKQGMITSFFNYKFCDVFGIFLICIIALKFVEERKIGLWSVVYISSKKKRLNYYRLLILLISSIIINVLFYGSILIQSSSMFEKPDFSNNIQTIMGFSDCYLNISIMTAIIIYISIKILALFLIGSIIWFAISAFRNKNIALLILMLLCVFEYTSYQYISNTSKFVFFKYVNIFSGLDALRSLGFYNNINFFGVLITNFIAVIITLLITLLIINTLNIIINLKKRPEERNSIKLYELAKKIISKISIGKRLGIYFQEIYKILFKNKGVIIFLLFFIIVINQKSSLKYIKDIDDIYIDYYYEKYSGPLSDEKIVLINSENEEISKKIEDVYEELTKAEPSKQKVLIQHSDELTNQKRGLEHLTNKLDELIKLKGKGYDIWIINPISFNNMLDINENSELLMFALIEICFFILIIAPMGAYENVNHTSIIFRTMKRGRIHLFWKRCLAMFTCAAVIVIPATIISIYNVWFKYGVDSVSAGVQSLEKLSWIPIRMNIITFFIIHYLLKVICLTLIGILCYIMSSRCKSLVIAYIWSFLLIIFPAVLAFMYGGVFKYTSVLYLLAYI